MSYHIITPSHSTNAVVPSLQYLCSPHEPRNPTLLPTNLVNNFKFIFLIRKPSASLPSLYRCFIPPLSDKTGERVLDSSELGYRETRILFDYIYPPTTRALSMSAPILVDAEDLLAHPELIVRIICQRLALPYTSSMLTWDTPEDYALAESAFKKYAGYHEDALKSTGLRPRTADDTARVKEAKTRDEEDEEWRERYGIEAARTIRDAVDLCQGDYEYLRQFRILPEINEVTKDLRD